MSSSPSRPLISVIILTANRRRALERCLRTLAEQDYEPFEVVVVDNGSTDGTRQWLGEQTVIRNLRLVANDAPGSLAEARNLGAEHAQGDVIAFLDDDCEPRPGWLARIAELLKEYDAVGGVLPPPEGLRFPWWWDEGLNWLAGISPPEHYDPRLAGRVSYPQAANMAFRREIFLAEKFQTIGGRLDGTVGVYRYAREDSELWRRLRRKGRRTRFDPTLIVTHHIEPKRLRLGYLHRRAWVDGLCLWDRERPREYIIDVGGDLAALPERTLRLFFRRPRRAVGILIAATTWTARQLGFIRGWIGQYGLGAAIADLSRGAGHYGKGLAKRISRRVLWVIARLVRWPRKIPAKPKHIGVICCGFLGDSVLLGPLLATLRRAHTGSKITLLGYGFAAQLHARNANIDRVIELSPRRFLFGFERLKEFWRVFRTLGADVLLVPYYHEAPAVPLIFAHRAAVVGFHDDMGLGRRLWYDLLDQRVVKDFERHEVENLLEMARTIKTSGVYVTEVLRAPNRSYDLPPLPTPSAQLTAFLTRHGLEPGGFVVVHIGATGEGKAWPLERWGELARRIEHRWPEHRVVFIGLARLRPHVAKLITEFNLRAIDGCANRPLADTAALIQKAACLVTTDSGPKHLAMALGTPTVALYGNSSERRWGAWAGGERHRAVISPGWDLTPEEMIGLPADHKMRLIGVGEVFGAISEVLGAGAGAGCGA